MIYLRDLRVRLQDRRNRMHRIDMIQYEAELGQFLDHLDNTPYIRSLLDLLHSCEPLDFEKWKSEEGAGRRVMLPASETERAKICHLILQECASDTEGRAAIGWGGKFCISTKYAEMYEAVTNSVLDPLVNYLHDRIDDSSHVLFALERFKFKVEWFRQEELHRRYENDTTRGEANLNLVLREALFDYGIDYPFTEPVSPSGQTDVVAMLDSSDSLVLEVKVFDPGRQRGKRHVCQGFHQVNRYADDYQQNVGYLVVFNCSDRQIVFPSEAGGEVPPRITHAGKTFFLIAVDVNPNRASASKENPSRREQVTREDLRSADAAAGL